MAQITTPIEANNPEGTRKTMAAKKGPHYQMGTHHRDKIKNSNVLNALIEHVEGEREMLPSQVTAGLGLLKKVMPDLTNNDITSGGEKLDQPTTIILKAASDIGND